MNIALLIPAYNPDETLVELVHSLIELQFTTILIVNDGSKPECDSIFQRLKRKDQCAVLTHAVNLGKGRALKTGLNYFSLNYPDCTGIVTADADGQHSPQDILKVALSLEKNPKELIIGAREFSKNIPFRSLLGNVLTKYLFRFLVGKKVSDTQSGLRGIPNQWIPYLLPLKGERYEFEINMLVLTKTLGIDIIEEPIKTIYIDDNRASHFNPILDSMRIYFLLFRFAFSSMFAALVDFIVFVINYKITGSLFWSIVNARIVSSFVNFLINKRHVFHNKSKMIPPLLKYYTLVILLGAASYTLISTLKTQLSMNVIVSKVMVETLLFLASFSIQRDFVFKNRENDQ
jgi:glycosyltransferase involved in cell wall biosynthesis